MNDEVIIDGVNVKECISYAEQHGKGAYETIYNYCHETKTCCGSKENYNCKFKQIKRLEEGYYIKGVKDWSQGVVCVDTYLQEVLKNEALKKENIKLKAENNVYKNSIIANHDREVGRRFEQVLDKLDRIQELVWGIITRRPHSDNAIFEKILGIIEEGTNNGQK